MDSIIKLKIKRETICAKNSKGQKMLSFTRDKLFLIKDDIIIDEITEKINGDYIMSKEVKGTVDFELKTGEKFRNIHVIYQYCDRELENKAYKVRDVIKFLDNGKQRIGIIVGIQEDTYIVKYKVSATVLKIDATTLPYDLSNIRNALIPQCETTVYGFIKENDIVGLIELNELEELIFK